MTAERLKAAILDNQNRKWEGGPYSAVYSVSDAKGEILLGQVVRHGGSGWNAFNLQHTNLEQTGPMMLDGSPFACEEDAKQAVEDHWTVIR